MLFHNSMPLALSMGVLGGVSMRTEGPHAGEEGRKTADLRARGEMGRVE